MVVCNTFLTFAPEASKKYFGGVLLHCKINRERGKKMKIQNNVSYNNPTFEARIKLTGSRKLAEELANAFEGGCVSQGRREKIMVERDLFTDQILIATDSDAGVLTKTLIDNGLNPKFRRLFCHTDKLKSVWKNFFENADKIVLKENEPLKLAFEFPKQAEKLAIKLANAIRAGLFGQSEGIVAPAVKVIEGRGKIYLATGFVKNLFDNAQVIHVAEEAV